MKDSDYDKLSDFYCGVAQLDDFFHYEIKECVLHHYLAAYCALTEDDTIVAVFTLMNDAVIIDLVYATFSSYDRAGCQFITVDAINTPATTKFYIENQFNFQTNRDFYDDTRRMYRII